MIAALAGAAQSSTLIPDGIFLPFPGPQKIALTEP
jgi:hypothetical protein